MSRSRRKAQSKVVLRVEELERRDAPAVLSSFAVAGVEFNDATRRADGGLWQLNPLVAESNQPTGFVARYVSDLTNVKDTINAERLVGGPLHNVSATTNTHLNTILHDINLLIGDGSLAPNLVNPGNAQLSVPGSPNARAHQTAVRTENLQITNIVHNDDFLADLAVTNGDTNPVSGMPLADGIQGFQKVPPKLAVPLEDAPHATFNQIGRIFNDAANRIMGGLGSVANENAIRADIRVMISSLTELAQDMQANPGVDQQLARIHVLVIRDQLPLWVRFIDQAASTTDSNTRQVAPKGSNDITLDLIDIAQGDPVLAGSLSATNPGWAVYPDYSITQPTPYRDSDAQKASFATMDSGAVNLGNEGVNIVMGVTPQGDYITRLQNFGTFVGNFVNSGGGIFRARFNNELVAINSTNGSAIVAMIDAVNTGNLDEANAAAMQMRMNTADVSGNTRWFTGTGTPGDPFIYHRYDANATTEAGVLSLPGSTDIFA
jgi:hypothetical protein